MTNLLKRLWPLLLIAAAIAALFLTGANEYLSLDALRANEAVLRQAVADNVLLSLAIFVGVYIAVVTTYIPGASILTLTGGFLFGTWIGAGATVIGATIGALGAYALIRTAIGEPLRRKAEASGGLLKRLIDGFGGNAFSYVLSLRLVPAAPFWLVNAAAGVGSAPVRPYALATLLGIIPGTVIYSGIGAGLGELFRRGETPNLSIIFEPQILWPLVGLAALSFLPAVWKAIRGRKAVSV
jgi:uncharacterized membrane protein YdjX (TVP38/TMEM64 family)